MSLPGSSRSIRRQCQLRLHSGISPFPSLHYSSNLHPRLAQDHFHLQHNHLAPRPPLSSCFHTTSSYNALYRTPRKSPALRRAANMRDARVSSPPRPAGIGPESHITGDLTVHKKWLATGGMDNWADAVLNRDLKTDITWPIFEATGLHLLECAHGGPPTLAAIENNPRNLTPLEVFKIGKLILPLHQPFQHWVSSASALAKVRPAIYIQAANYLKEMRAHNKSQSAPPPPPRDVPILQAVEALATGPFPDPRAMHLHARVLCHRQQYREAMALLDEILELIYPAKKLEPGFETGLYFPPIDSFWDTYMWVQGLMLDHKYRTKHTPEEIYRRAAEEFQQPEYLVRYAGHLREQGRWDQYEKYMHMAVMAGHRRATRRLACYYYLIAQGRYPRRGQSAAAADFRPVDPAQEGQGLLQERHRPWWQRLRDEIWAEARRPSLTHYRAMARELFELAAAYGSPESVVVAAVMAREEGRLAEGEQMIHTMLRAPQFQGPEWAQVKVDVQSLLEKWGDLQFKFKIPEEYFVL
ncbi:uncharacterized protein BO72DRAFT_443446 [Aspergillus fijiensis CBS 313.89]|uniref:Uncharacterized protein n=1 Tax=Aspergillus fijiensis CBS 313.89 TaxID=1448319 RepID=A0A8G1W300_9EURO|nr:uncharacterized protein BO72DRAFT_443446 [Aspergillus fijiensis CBS 313.89]RAK82605.1 hypothetical protein BO72DRAFT_443446 [Aspergillus fijiensis CBS 313.89]